MDSARGGHPQIRWMMSNDIESVMSIEQDSVSESWSFDRFKAELTHTASRYIVLEAATPVSAFGGLWLGVDEVHIVTMAVRESQRRNGYGGLVLRGLLAVAMDLGLSTARLECHVGNNAARALYRKFGFVEVGERRSYYSNGEDAVIMTTEEFDSRAYGALLTSLDAEIQVRFPGFLARPRGPRPSVGAGGDV